MIVFWNSIVFSARMLAARPLLTLLAVVTMGIGIGISTSQIAIYKGLMDPELPFPESEQIVSISLRGGDGKQKTSQIHKNLLTFLKERQTSFDQLFSYIEGTVNVFYQNKAIRYSGSMVSSDFIETVGIPPLLGEGFQEGDNAPTASKKVVLGYETWVRDFASDTSIIGKDILVNSENTMVIGVMPKDFNFPFNSHIWVPDVYFPGNTSLLMDSKPTVMVAGRLKHGTSPSEAALELTSLKKEFIENHAGNLTNVIPADSSFHLQPFVDSVTDDDTKNILILSTFLVTLVLLIACANVTNLLLAGFSTRLKEIAVRSSLGATHFEIGLQLLIESLLISLGGATIGLIYCMWAIDFGNQEFANMEVPFWYQISFTPEVILSAFTTASICGLVAGILPVHRVMRLSLNEILQDDSRIASAMSVGVTNRTLVVMQISVSCALLIVAGMMMREFSALKKENFGYDPTSVIAARLGLSETKYQGAIAKTEFAQNLLKELRSQDMIEYASISTRLQSIFPADYLTYQVETDDGEFSDVEYHAYSDGISTDFFSTLGINDIEGEDFETIKFDGSSLPSVIVTNEFVEKHYPNENAIGKRIKIVRENIPLLSSGSFIIRAVAPDTIPSTGGGKKEDAVGIYSSYYSLPSRFLTINVRPKSGYNPYSLVPLIKRCVAKVDKEIPLYYVETPRDSYESQFAGTRFITNLFKIFSGVALFLCFVGTFGISSFSVLERMQEIGVRKSLGATSEEIFLLIIKQGVLQLTVGITLGIIGGLSLSYALKTVFTTMSLVDPLVYISVILLLTFSSILATLYPARKAALILPAEATRVN